MKKKYNYGGLTPQQMLGIAGMVGTTTGTMLSQNKDTALFGDVLSGAGMGMALGPWGALAGGVLGLGKGLISQGQERKERQQMEDQRRIGQQANAWYSKEQQPYDTTGYYQMAKGGEIPYRMTPKQKMVISKKKMADGGAINSPISLNSTFYGKQPELMDLWKSNNSMDKLRYVSQRNSLDFTLPLISGKNHSLGFDASIGQNKTFETKINHQNSLGGSNLLPTEYRTDPIPWETKKEPFFNVGLNWQPGLSENKNTNKGTAQNTKIGIGYSYNNNTSGPYVLINPEAGITFGNQYSHYDKRRPFYYGMGARGKFRMDKENNGKIKGDSNEFRTHASEVEAYAKLNYKNKNGFGVNTKIGYDFDNEAPNFQIGLTKSFGGKKKNQSNFNIKDNVLFPIYDTFKNHDRTVYRNTRFLANGGEIIEAEGQETMMYPNGRMEDIKGPSHEEGGVTMKLKPGTKIFSNRIKARKDLIERLKNY